MARRVLLILVLLIISIVSHAQADSVRQTPAVKAIRKCSPAVVNIATEQILLLKQNPLWGSQFGSQFDTFHDQFFNSFPSPVIGQAKTQSLGSGVLVSKDGLIVTNAHVVGKATTIYVIMNNGKTLQARLIGTDNKSDIALIQIATDEPTPYIELADDPIIGETVISMGNPFGLQNSVSAGIISGTHRTFYTQPQMPSLTDLIQTDASINIGSSGGALIDLEGKLLGINLAMLDQAQGVAFAVPSTKIKKMLDEYEKVRSEKKK